MKRVLLAMFLLGCAVEDSRGDEPPPVMMPDPVPVPEPDPVPDPDPDPDPDPVPDPDPTPGDLSEWERRFAEIPTLPVTLTVSDADGTVTRSVEGAELIVSMRLTDTVRVSLDSAHVEGLLVDRSSDEPRIDDSMHSIVLPSTGPYTFAPTRLGRWELSLCVDALPICGAGLASTHITFAVSE